MNLNIKPLSQREEVRMFCNCTYLGIASIKWEIIDGANFAAKIVIPFGAKGVLDLPVTATSLLRVNGVRVENKIELGFGSYEILLSNPDVIKFNVL